MRNEPYFIDLEVDISFLKNQTTLLTYKIPVNKIEDCVKIASEYLLINPKMILTLFVYRRKESIRKKSARVNYEFMQRIELNKKNYMYPKLPQLE